MHAPICAGSIALIEGKIRQDGPVRLSTRRGADPEPRCLLARHHGARPDSYSLLAGFVEIGEGLEGAVRREVVEEACVWVGG